MKRTPEEHAARFDEIATEYDDRGEEYRACVSLVVDYADPRPDDVVLDLGCGTGAIGLALSAGAGKVVPGSSVLNPCSLVSIEVSATALLKRSNGDGFQAAC